MSHRRGLGSEHPLNDTLQPVFFIVYLGIWSLDSFIFHFSTIFAGAVPFAVCLSLCALSLAAGAYLIKNAHVAVFGKTEKPELITTGVYAWIRHPMYLGYLLICLGLFFITLSLLSLIMWIGLFVFFDRMATYEERDLYKILGEPYLKYQKCVPKWFLGRGRKEKE